jgi:hypothetical protein
MTYAPEGSSTVLPPSSWKFVIDVHSELDVTVVPTTTACTIP